MQRIGVDHFPDSIRVQLSAQGATALWEQVTEQGGVTAVAEQYGYPRSRLYNWQHKHSFLPASFVATLLDDADRYVVALKGGGRSEAMTVSTFPFPVNDELLTRVACSVRVNRDGVPIYQAQDAGLVNRFTGLLQRYGEAPISVYRRAVYEVRYPKYLQDIFEQMDYKQDIAAVVDEQGSIEGGRVTTDEKELSVETFDGDLYHRGKRLQLALARGDTRTITQLMASEAEKVRYLRE